MLSLILVELFSGCGNNDPTPTGPVLFTVTDLAGHEIPFVKHPQRIISLAPSNTEILFALGAGDRVVGRTRFCDFPEETSSITDIGDLGNPDRERILSLDPDCVVASYKTRTAVIDFLKKNGIPVCITEATSFDEIYASIGIIGQLVGKDAAAVEIEKQMRDKVAFIENRLVRIPRVRCYYAVSFGQFGNWTAGPGSFLHEIIEKAGGENLGKIIGKPWGEISTETILALNPDVVILGKYSGPIESLVSSAGFRDLDAVKRNRVIIVDDDLAGRPGPRIAEGLYEIAEKLHPDVILKKDDK